MHQQKSEGLHLLRKESGGPRRSGNLEVFLAAMARIQTHDRGMSRCGGQRGTGSNSVDWNRLALAGPRDRQLAT